MDIEGYSRSPLSLDQAKETMKLLKGKSLGKWNPQPIQDGAFDDNFGNLSRQQLAAMRIPNGCYNFSILSGISSDPYDDNISSQVADIICPFSLSAPADGGYGIAFQHSFRIEIELPVTGVPGSFLIRGKGSNFGAKKEAREVASLLEVADFLLDDSEFKLSFPDDCGIFELQRTEDDENAKAKFGFDNFDQAVSRLGVLLPSSPLSNKPFSVYFHLGAGYLDCDEELPDGEHAETFAEVAAGCGFETYEVSIRRKVVIDGWDEREAARFSLREDQAFTEILGSLTDGSGEITVSMRYGVDGYHFSIEGLQSVTDQNSALINIFEVLNLTA